MSLLPFTECARVLGVHPKTLRSYLKRAQMQLSPHPTDARIKCLTDEQLQRLMVLFDRKTPEPVPEILEAQTATLSSPGSGSEAEAMNRLAALEQQVHTLSEHVATLALALLAERERAVEHRLSVLESTLQALTGTSCSSSTFPQPGGTIRVETIATSVQQIQPAEQRARSRMPVLIEYSQQGVYVIVSSQDGELTMTPDSPEWFDLLATLCSFRFVGQSGRFTAYRESKRNGPTRSWSAHRTVHQQRYKCHVGVTDHLTIARLEQVAAKLQEDAGVL